MIKEKKNRRFTKTISPVLVMAYVIMSCVLRD